MDKAICKGCLCNGCVKNHSAVCTRCQVCEFDSEPQPETECHSQSTDPAVKYRMLAFDCVCE
jgi:hypothetical protein